MTKADREFVEVTAELAAHKAVGEMTQSLNEHTRIIATAVEQIAQNQKNINSNKKDIKTNRKYYFFGIGLLFLGVIGAFIKQAIL